MTNHPDDLHSVETAITNAEEIKPRLLVDDVNPDRTVEALRDILAEAGGLYDRGGPARIYRDKNANATRAQRLRAEDLVLHTHRVCRPYKIKHPRDGGERTEVDSRLPKFVAEMYCGWEGEWNLPVLCGISSAPLLHDDGTFHAVDGYDPETGLWCEDVPDVGAAVPRQPTFHDAEAALQYLRQTFATFCFADAVITIDAQTGIESIDLAEPPGADESAFLAALLTAVCRPSLHLAPAVLIRAAALSGAGSGKGLLARCICDIAFGREPHAVPAGAGKDELDKRIAAELIEAGPVLFLDNLNNRTFKSDLLASAITERPARVRILGQSRMMPVNAAAFVILTGNGVTLSEDIVRRFLIVALDARTEDPEARTFARDIRLYCRENRLALLGAALTIWRWGRQRKDLPQGKPMGSFDQWLRWVRDPLLALGCQDPAARISETKTRDAERLWLADVFQQWWGAHQDQPIGVKDIAEHVRSALDPLCRGRQHVASKLEKLSGARAAGRVLVRQAPAGRYGVAVYALQSTSDPDQHPEHDGEHQPDAPDAFPARSADECTEEASASGAQPSLGGSR